MTIWEPEPRFESGSPGAPRRRSPWIVLGLCIVTGGVYAVYWMWIHARAFDDRIRGKSISWRFFATVLLLLLADWAVFFLGLAAPPPDTYQGIDSSLSALSGGLILLAALRLRRRILYLAEVPGAPPPRVGLLGTVFLNAAYLQARLNRYESRLTESRAAFTRGPFRDSRRLAWLACLALPVFITTLVAVVSFGPRLAEWVASSSFARARDRAQARFAPLDPERFRSPGTGAHPIFEPLPEIDLDPEEKERLKNLWRGALPPETSEDEARFLRDALARNREPLRTLEDRLSTPLSTPRRGLGLDYLEGEGPTLPSTLGSLPIVARLVATEGLLAARRRGATSAVPAVERLGDLARTLEREPAMVPQLIGSTLESLQLAVVAAALERAPDEGTSRDLADALLDRPVRDRMMDLLALEVVTVIRFERRESMALAEGDEAEPSLWQRGMASSASQAFLRYALSGNLDMIGLHADLFDAPYTEMRSKIDVELDPEEMGFFEKMREVGAFRYWWMPARLRAIGDSRRGARLALSTWIEPESPSCQDVEDRLGPLAEIYEVECGQRAGCRLRYRLAVDFDEASRGEVTAPPFDWRLGCGALRDSTGGG